MPVRKRGARWYYDFSIKGSRYKAAVPEARTKAEAIQAEVLARSQVFQGTYGQENFGKLLFAVFVEKHYLPWAKTNKKSWSNDEYHASRLVARFSGKRLRDVSPILVEKLKRDLANEKTIHDKVRAPASVNHVLTVLSGIYTLAISLDLAATNPCRRVKLMKVDNQQYRYLGWDEEAALMEVLNVPPVPGNRLEAANAKQIKAARARLRDAIQVAVGTGLREGEQLRLMPQHCDFDRNVIIVTQTKTSRNREVPMSDDVRAILVRLCRSKRRDDYLFVNPTTKATLLGVWSRVQAGVC